MGKEMAHREQCHNNIHCHKFERNHIWELGREVQDNYCGKE